MKQTNYIFIIILFSSLPFSNCFSQKNSPVEYIDAGIKLIEIFTKQTKSNSNCVYGLEINNMSKESIKVEITIPESDSIIKKLIIPINNKGSTYSLSKRNYNCRFINNNGIAIKETEILLTECGTIKMVVE